MKTQRHRKESSLWRRVAISGLLSLSVAVSAEGAYADDFLDGSGNDGFAPVVQPIAPAAMKAWQPANPPKADQPVPPAGIQSPPPPPGGEGPAQDSQKAEEKPADTKSDAPEAFSLQEAIFGDYGKTLTANQWKIAGSTAQSWTGNFQSPRDRYNGPVTWTDRSNDYELNQQWLYLERATDTSKQDWDLGMRIDANYGSNYRWMTSAGFEDKWKINTSHDTYGLALPQLYIETAYKKLKVKWGHYGSPVGYFVLDTTQNFFSSLPYTYQYGEPFTHWGFLSTYTPDDHWAIGLGMTRGWDNLTGAGTGSRGVGYIGTLTYTFADKSSIAFVNLVSNELSNLNTTDTFSTRYFQTFVYNKPINEKWSYVFQSDFGAQPNAVGLPTAASPDGRPIGTAFWYGVNQYAYYKMNDQWTWGFNFEWFRDDGGFRVGGVLPTASTPGSQVSGLPLNRYGYDGNFFQVTMGPKWQPHPNLFIRPNMRWDFYSGPSDNIGNLKPYDDGNKNWQGILGIDMCWVY